MSEPLPPRGGAVPPALPCLTRRAAWCAVGPAGPNPSGAATLRGAPLRTQVLPPGAHCPPVLRPCFSHSGGPGDRACGEGCRPRRPNKSDPLAAGVRVGCQPLAKEPSTALNGIPGRRLKVGLAALPHGSRGSLCLGRQGGWGRGPALGRCWVRQAGLWARVDHQAPPEDNAGPHALAS